MKAAIFAILAGLCWGIGEFFTKQVLHTGRVGPLTAIAVRSTVALPVLWLVYFAFVQMQTVDEAKRAVTELHDKDYMGRKLVVSGAKAVEERRSERNRQPEQ